MVFIFSLETLSLFIRAISGLIAVENESWLLIALEILNDLGLESLLINSFCSGCYHLLIVFTVLSKY